MLTLVIVLFLVFLVNIPFGYWRANVKKFSAAWFFSVHLPVPLIAYLRSQYHYGWIAITIALYVGAYFLGQLIGGKTSLAMRRYGKVSSFLLYDLIQRTWIILIGRS